MFSYCAAAWSKEGKSVKHLFTSSLDAVQGLSAGIAIKQSQTSPPTLSRLQCIAIQTDPSFCFHHK